MHLFLNGEKVDAASYRCLNVADSLNRRVDFYINCYHFLFRKNSENPTDYSENVKWIFFSSRTYEGLQQI